ncbi:MAG: NifU family protein [Streptomyces sp.]|jgi:Fe-S cluster biogenesis protein NfuA/nitrite reductase/ring-hydroxylating ferredoxin subunit|nr:NifU family protein [Streptomyces sp.]
MTAVRDAATSTEPSFEQLALAVDDAAKAVAELTGAARQAADEMRSAVEAAHKAALVTIVRTLRDDEAGRALLFRLVDDPLIHLLFSLHGIIRPDPMTAAQAALESVRPGLRSHGGDVELVRIEDGVAYVQLSGACNGCSMSSVTMRNTVEQALVQSVPGIRAVEVVPSEPSPTIIPLSSLRRREETADELEAAGWVRTVPTAQILDGAVTQLSLTSTRGVTEDVVVVRIDASLTAYKDECAHQGLPLGDAELNVKSGTLTCPWHGFCYDALSGECVSAPGATLEQRPLRVIDGDVWIRVE